MYSGISLQWLLFAAPVGAIGLLFVALMLNSLRLYFKRKASLLAKMERDKKRRNKSSGYARNDVLR